MTDAELIRNTLNMWANYIETSNVSLSANDVCAMISNRPDTILHRRLAPKTNRLDVHQNELVKRLRDLATKQGVENS